jgi:hypothetical protein
VSLSPVNERALKSVAPFAEVDAPPASPFLQPSSLSQLTDEASLSSLAPRLRAVLEEIAGPGDNVMDTLSRNVESLQEGFVEALYSTLTEAGVDIGEKLTLRLNADNVLIVAGEHPQKESVEATVSRDPALSSAFSEIAAQSELLRDIGNINKVMNRQGGVEHYAQMAGMNSFAVYQMSLKGDMSHFYFGRPG